MPRTKKNNLFLRRRGGPTGPPPGRVAGVVIGGGVVGRWVVDGKAVIGLINSLAVSGDCKIKNKRKDHAEKVQLTTYIVLNSTSKIALKICVI